MAEISTLPISQSYTLSQILQARQQAEVKLLQQRHELGWQIARQVAQILRQEFQAEQVWLFGSLVHGHWFTRWSDLDLAVMGLSAPQFYRAVSRLIDLTPEFKIDLVDLTDCNFELKQKILMQGVKL